MSQAKPVMASPGIAYPAPVFRHEMIPRGKSHLRDSLQDPVLENASEPFGLPRLLEALINDCFQSTMDVHALSAERLEYAQKFQKYLVECHSEENLAFLMEIFRYEYFYERVFPDTPAPKALSASLVDRSLEKFIDTLPYPTPSMGRHLRRASVKSQSNVSLASSTGVPFALDFDEPGPESHDPWTHFSHQQLSQDLDLDLENDAGLVVRVDDLSPTSSRAETEPEPETLVSDQWQYIIGMYVEQRAEAQINLSNKTYRAIMDCHVHGVPPHSPHILLAAKQEVMQLIHENTYHPFTKQMQRYCTGSGCEYAGACANGGCSLIGSPLSTARHSQTLPFPRKLAGESTLTPSSTSSRNGSGASTPLQVNSNANANANASHPAAASGPVAPVPQKKRSKFLHSLSGHGTGSSSSDVGNSSSPLNGILTHFKPNHNSHLASARAYNSAPQSPAHTLTPLREISPLSHIHDAIPRPRSSAVPETHLSPSILGKLWKKRR